MPHHISKEEKHWYLWIYSDCNTNAVLMYIRKLNRKSCHAVINHVSCSVHSVCVYVHSSTFCSFEVMLFVPSPLKLQLWLSSVGGRELLCHGPPQTEASFNLLAFFLKGRKMYIGILFTAKCRETVPQLRKGQILCLKMCTLVLN